MKPVYIFLALNFLHTTFGSEYERGRIIRGTREEDIAQFPFVVSVLRKSCTKPKKDVNKKKTFKFLGGGAIIGEHWVITAAECVIHVKRKNKIYVGYNSTTWDSPYRRHVEEFFAHPDYKPSGDNDIALLHFKKPFPKNFLITMAPSDYEYTRCSKAIAFGWGVTERQAHGSKDLYSVSLQLQPWKKCYKYNTQKEVEFTENMFCAGSKKKGTCIGDQGAPLYQVDNNENKVLLGVLHVNKEVRCAISKYSNLFADLRNFTIWILHTTRSIGKAVRIPSRAIKMKFGRVGPC